MSLYADDSYIWIKHKSLKYIENQIQQCANNLTKKSILKTLDIIHNADIRLSIGAFKSNPIESIYVIAGELPLKYRRHKLLLKFAALNAMYKYKSTYHTIFNLRFNNTFNNNINLKQPIYRRINKLSIDHQISLKYITNYEIPSTPPWTNQIISLNTSLAKYKKKSTTSTSHKQLFYELTEEFFNFKHIYTNASKTENGTGIAIIAPNFQKKIRINNNCSIFSAEMLAIYSAIEYIKNSQLPNNYVIFTDSLSSVKCLSSHGNINSFKSKIIEAVNNYENKITIVWIPGHSNIEGNEKADYLAKEAANDVMAKINEILCTYEDTLKCINFAIKKNVYSNGEEK
ncbi:hypothetical protein QTP88_028972 [Uroleucon formosanum]